MFNATSTLCSVCIAGGLTSHTFGAVPGEKDQYFDRYNLVTSELGLYALQWRCQYERRSESSEKSDPDVRMQDGDGEAESFFHIMKARRVSRTEISLRMYAAL